MLEIESLSAGYPNHPVLENISLTFPKGSVTVIAGPNGCGKSTLLKALAGILNSAGTRKLNGECLQGLSPQEMARRIACLPKNRAVPEITARRLVLHGRFPYLSYPRRYRREDEEIADAALKRLGIEDLAHRSMVSLSGGQRQKVYIAMVLAQDTPVVLLDEPNTYLDIAHQIQMMELARFLAREGKVVVLVLHDLTMALEWADRLVVMDGGRILTQGSPEEVFQSGCLPQAFGVMVNRIRTEQGWKYYYG